MASVDLGQLPELTQTLTLLSNAPDRINEDAIHTIEGFIILLYDRTSIETDIDKARRKLFAKKNNVQLIPPTRATLENHMSGSDPSSCTNTAITNRLGMDQTSGVYEPLWTTLLEASKICKKLVSCKCKDCMKSANARWPVWNAHHCVLATGSVLRIEVASLRQMF